VAQTVAYADARKERPHTLGRAVETIGEDPLDAIRWLLLGYRALKRPIGLGESGRTRLCRIAQVPEDPPAHNRRQIDLVSETAAVLFIGEDIGGQG
jgi:hypothetical protein